MFRCVLAPKPMMVRVLWVSYAHCFFLAMLSLSLRDGSLRESKGLYRACHPVIRLPPKMPALCRTSLQLDAPFLCILPSSRMTCLSPAYSHIPPMFFKDKTKDC